MFGITLYNEIHTKAQSQTTYKGRHHETSIYSINSLGES